MSAAFLDCPEELANLIKYSVLFEFEDRKLVQHAITSIYQNSKSAKDNFKKALIT
jgi:hypothetical protein